MIQFDSAFLRADLAGERAFAVGKAKPWLIPELMLAMMRGTPALQRSATVHAATGPQLDAYPHHAASESFIGAAKGEGRELVWLSAESPAAVSADARLTDLTGDAPDIIGPAATADDLGLDLRERYPDGFAFLGRAASDLPLWRTASERFGVDLSPSLRRRAEAEGLGIVELSRKPSLARALWRSMRPHQWLKNLLVLVPFALSVGGLDPREFGIALLAFACLCALTSGTYIVNDLSDIEADRRHPRKRKRPIASGDLPVATAVPVGAALILAGLLGACLLRYAFAAALGAYLVLTLAYSFRLKRMAMVDVVVIAMLFTLRILAGMLLVSEKPSHWLLMFSIFFFLSLAFMKREVEFNVVSQAGRTTLSGRGYDLDDRLYVLCCGLSCGIASVVIFSLFITATIDRVQLNYRAPELLWGVVGLLGYWVLRMWMLTTRGLMNDDPILFAARDRTSLILGALCAALAFGAQVIRL